MAYDTILFSVDGGIARLTLNRPDKLNSFNTQMHGEVREALSGLPGQGAAAAMPGNRMAARRIDRPITTGSLCSIPASVLVILHH